MSNKIEKFMVAAAVTGAIALNAGDASACGATPCGTTTTPTTPGLTVNTTNNTTDNSVHASASNSNNIGIKNENEISNNVGVKVDTKGTVGNVTGGEGGQATSTATSATTNSGNSTNNNTTVYESRRIPVSTAYGASASAGYADGCAMTGRGFGAGVQTMGVGVSANISGNKVWNEDSKICHEAAIETAIVQKSGTPADSAAALLTASEKSDAVKNAVQKLQSPEGKTLMNLFAVPVVAPQQQPVVNNYITTEKAAQPETCPVGTTAIWDKTNNTLVCKPH